MTIKSVTLFLSLLLPIGASAAETKLAAFSGTVEVRTAREGKWEPAKANMEIPEGGAVRTSADGGAVVQMPNKTRVWIRESSSLELEQRQTLASRLALVFGRIKVRVPHLMRRERFEVRTPSAVCAVRGTEFTVDTDEKGAMNINVLYGEVKLNFTVPPEKGAAYLDIPQGRNMTLAGMGKPGKVALMTAEQEKGSLENWHPGLSAPERRKEMKAKDNDRAQMREFARVTNSTEDSVKSFLNIVKESDLEAGRTLKDIHGNLVRVDQRLMRPDNSTLQFFNLVKRPSYSYNHDASASGGFKYNGAATVANRLDLMQMTMKFNQDLPQRIEQWPGFFSGNDVKAEYATFIMANRTYRDEIFFIGEGYKYDAVRDELVSNPAVVGDVVTGANDRAVLLAGTLTGAEAVAGLNAISRLNIKFSGVADGVLNNTASGSPVPFSGDVKWAIQVPQTAVTGTNHYEVTGDPALSQYRADLYQIGNAGAYVWYARENYAINNSGSLQSVDDFTSSNMDPFTILRNTAGETIMYIKQSNGSPAALMDNDAAYANISASDQFFNVGGGSRYPSGTNIDLVIIPDLALAAVQKMLPALTELNN